MGKRHLAREPGAVPPAGSAAIEDEFRRLVDPWMRELVAYGYRLLGSPHDAEDAAQEALLRAWRGLGTLEHQGSFRAWLYRIATRVCLERLKRRPRRVLPAGYGPAAEAATPPGSRVREPIWLEPFPDARLPDPSPGPEARYAMRESVALGFLVAIQRLPARQRAVLLLRDVLGFSAGEAAGVVGCSVAAVNSALQRARGTLERLQRARAAGRTPAVPPSTADEALLARYLRAWEAGDVGALVALLREEATFSMPPYPLWYRGRDRIGAFLAATVLAVTAAPKRLLPLRANGQPAFAVYQRDAEGGAYRACAIMLLAIADGWVEEVVAFCDGSLHGLFGLPPVLPARPVHASR